MLHLKKKLCIRLFSNALVAESVDAADLKSVVRKDVPVQVWPSAPIFTTSFLRGCNFFIILKINSFESMYCIYF